MTPKKIVVVATLCVLGFGLYWYSDTTTVPPANIFPGLYGPAPTTLPTPPPVSSLDEYSLGGDDTLALWVKDSESSWLGLAIGMKSMGIPFVIVDDIAKALSHDVIVAYPSLTGANTAPQALQQLAEHVRAGGTLVAFNVIGGGMPSLFGFSESIESRNVEHMTFSNSAFNQRFARSEVETKIQLSFNSSPENAFPGTTYVGAKHAPVATFADGSAGITFNDYEVEGSKGYAYAIGIDLGHFILRAINGRFSGLTQNYVNTYQPKIDTFLRFMQAVYQQGESNAIVLSPTPQAKKLTVLITHDIDFTASLRNISSYAQYEKSAGVPATYFIQTKYVTDYNDVYFFDNGSREVLRELPALGMEVASHSVAHSNEFRSMPLGSGKETFPAYQPFVFDFKTVRDASVSGELRVSKFLLEEVSGGKIVSFRPGHLSLPESLPQMLEATGYKYSSSITANEALTHLPFRSSYNRTYGSTVDVYEFPVTIEDEQSPLNDRFEQVVSVANNISAYHGLMNLLVHTETTGEKLEFLKRFVSRFSDDAWFGTMSGYGDWWSARQSVILNGKDMGENQYYLSVNSGSAIEGLTLEVPTGWQYLSGLSGAQQTQELLALPSFSGEVELQFRKEN